jgi:hypothetical protein
MKRATWNRYRHAAAGLFDRGQVKSICPWCQTLNPVEEDWCERCGHRAHLPRVQCDCAACDVVNGERSGC